MTSYNPYWPVFLSIEGEVSTLMDHIHCTPGQFSVYSTKMVGILLQAVSEVESISKDLYARETGKPKDGIQFDHVALKKLNSLWRLDKKVVDIATHRFYGSKEERALIPFRKDATTKGQKNWTWNDAYQNLKHNRIDNLHKGNLENLLSATAALFLLNLYYDEREVPLGIDSEGNWFRTDRGSSVFSIRTSRVSSLSDIRGRRYFVDDRDGYDKSTYVIAPTEESIDRQEIAFTRMNEAIHNEFRAQMLEVVQADLLARTGKEFLSEELHSHQDRGRSPEAMGKTLVNSKDVEEAYMQLMASKEYRAILNKHELV